ncbi:unnamed protein product, partial [Trichogramma brassicae]
RRETHLLKPKTPFFDENNFLGRYGALKNLEKIFCGFFSSKSKKKRVGKWYF